MSRPLVVLALTLAALAGLRAAAYCPRADPAWRALGAPLALYGRVLRLDRAAAVLRVHRALRRPPGHPHWPRRDRTVRVLLPPDSAPDCRAALEAPLRVGRDYVLFGERRGRNTAAALGPPLRATPNLLRRLRRVLAEGYIRPPKVEKMESLSISSGGRARFECRVSGRPPPRVTWYINDKPVEQSALRRLRVRTFRRRSVLVVRNATVEDSGRVECRARGAEGEPAVTFTNLTVSPPRPVETSLPRGTPCPMPNPTSYCMNGGTCFYFEQIGESSCTCPEGYEGQRCERKDVPHDTIYDDFWR